MYKRKMKLSPIHISLIALAILVVIADCHLRRQKG